MSTPDNWNSPQWPEYVIFVPQRWEDCVPENIAGMWDTFTDIQKQALAEHFAEVLYNAELYDED